MNKYRTCLSSRSARNSLITGYIVVIGWSIVSTKAIFLVKPKILNYSSPHSLPPIACTSLLLSIFNILEFERKIEIRIVKYDDLRIIDSYVPSKYIMGQISNCCDHNQLAHFFFIVWNEKVLITSNNSNLL